jgi:hypothetical protein
MLSSARLIACGTQSSHLRKKIQNESCIRRVTLYLLLKFRLLNEADGKVSCNQPETRAQLCVVT